MRYLPILLILAVLGIGASLPTSTQPGVIVGGCLLPEPAGNQILDLHFDVSGTYITGWTLRNRFDADRDGDVDLEDYAAFAAAFTGPK